MISWDAETREGEKKWQVSMDVSRAWLMRDDNRYCYFVRKHRNNDGQTTTEVILSARILRFSRLNKHIGDRSDGMIGSRF